MIEASSAPSFWDKHGMMLGRAALGIAVLSFAGWFVRLPAGDASNPPSACTTDWSKCTDNRDLMNNNKAMDDASYQCKVAATELARYGTPEFSFVPFSTFHAGSDYITTGIAKLIDARAKFQNGFGAMAHMRVVCTFDLRANKVTDVYAVPN